LNSKSNLITKLNVYYEELTSLSKEISKLLKDSTYPTDRLSELLNRKDFIIEQCVLLKKVIEGTDTNSDLSSENSDLIKEVMDLDKVNQELVKKSLFKIQQEIKQTGNLKGTVKHYKKANNSNKYGNLDKKG